MIFTAVYGIICALSGDISVVWYIIFSTVALDISIVVKGFPINFEWSKKVTTK